MKLKLKQAGYTEMNGYMGIVEFKDGLSVGDVHPRDARNIAISIQCEWEDGSSPNPAQNLLDSMNVRAGEESKVKKESAPVEKPKFVREELEAIADKGGIKALRAVAEPYGVKGVSIVELIDDLLALNQAQAAA